MGAAAEAVRVGPYRITWRVLCIFESSTFKLDVTKLGAKPAYEYRGDGPRWDQAAWPTELLCEVTRQRFQILPEGKGTYTYASSRGALELRGNTRRESMQYWHVRGLHCLDA